MHGAAFSPQANIYFCEHWAPHYGSSGMDRQFIKILWARHFSQTLHDWTVRGEWTKRWPSYENNEIVYTRLWFTSSIDWKFVTKILLAYLSLEASFLRENLRAIWDVSEKPTSSSSPMLATRRQFRNTANFTVRAVRKFSHNSVSRSWYTPHPSDPSSSRSNLLGWTIAGRRMHDYSLLVYRTNKVHRMWWQSVEAKIILEVASDDPGACMVHFAPGDFGGIWPIQRKACCFLLCFVPPVWYTWTVHSIRAECTCFCVSVYVVRQ